MYKNKLIILISFVITISIIGHLNAPETPELIVLEDIYADGYSPTLSFHSGNSLFTQPLTHAHFPKHMIGNARSPEFKVGAKNVIHRLSTEKELSTAIVAAIMKSICKEAEKNGAECRIISHED